MKLTNKELLLIKATCKNFEEEIVKKNFVIYQRQVENFLDGMAFVFKTISEETFPKDDKEYLKFTKNGLDMYLYQLIDYFELDKKNKIKTEIELFENRKIGYKWFFEKGEDLTTQNKLS